MQFSISAAARLYGKHRATLHRHIKQGRISAGHFPDGSPALEFSELRRAYGEPPHPPEALRQSATPSADVDATTCSTAILDELRALREEVRQLREQMQRLPPPTPPEAPTEPPQQAKEPMAGKQPPRTLADVLARFEGKQ